MARLYQCLPWDDKILDAPEEWLDWALSLNRLYPEGLSFESTEDLETRTEGQKANVGWANVLVGGALRRFKDRFTPKNIPKMDHIKRV